MYTYQLFDPMRWIYLVRGIRLWFSRVIYRILKALTRIRAGRWLVRKLLRRGWMYRLLGKSMWRRVWLEMRYWRVKASDAAGKFKDKLT